MKTRKKKLRKQTFGQILKLLIDVTCSDGPSSETEKLFTLFMKPGLKCPVLFRYPVLSFRLSPFLPTLRFVYAIRP